MKDADRACIGREPLLHMKRLPWAALFIFRKGEIVIGIVVSERSHESLAGHRTTLEVLGQKAERAPYRCVGVVVWTERTDPAVHIDFVPYRSVDDCHCSCRTRRGTTRRYLGGGKRQDDRKVFRPSPCHHGIHGNLLDSIFPQTSVGRGLHMPDHFIRSAASCGEHVYHAAFRRKYDWEFVGPVVAQEGGVK